MSKFKTYPAQVKAAEADSDGDGGQFEALVSVFGNVDAVGDRVVRGAFAKTLAEWEGSGRSIPVIWSHDWRSVESILGRVLEAKETDEGLWVRAQLRPSPRAQEVRALMAEGILDAFSFSYDVVKERKGEDGANELLELDLLEVGPCLVGVNRETRLLSVKAALAPHGTATSDGPWDGPANEARLPNDAGGDVYRQAYAWVDPDADPDTKAAHRFLHHEVSADGDVGPANVTACTTGIGVLNGGRGGTTIPDADRRGVWNHLARHLRDADRDPPELRAAASAAPPTASTGAPFVSFTASAPFTVSTASSTSTTANPANWTEATKGDLADPDRLRDLLTGAKAGRVLSKTNEDKLRDAARLITEVLSQLEPAETEEGEAAKDGAKPKAQADDAGPTGQEPRLRSPLAYLLQVEAI